MSELVTVDKGTSALRTSRNGRRDLWFFCPGCKNTHAVTVAIDGIYQQQSAPPVWGWNKDLIKPTITPSILCNKDDPGSICHSFVNDGNIQFLSDCHHELAGQTVPLSVYEE